MGALLLGGLIGLANGMRHACEPDHLAAVSTLAAEQKSRRATITLAMLWGAGHALVLFVVGGALIALRVEMPARLADVFELAVAAMLVLLGVRALRSAAHLGEPRANDHDRAHEHLRAHVRRPLVIGMVHGLAGSGALTALIVAAIPARGEALVCLAIYGIGAMIGMSLVAAIASVPLARVRRGGRAMATMMRLAGAVSMGLGGLWGWPIARRLLGV